MPQRFCCRYQCHRHCSRVWSTLVPVLLCLTSPAIQPCQAFQPSKALTRILDPVPRTEAACSGSRIRRAPRSFDLAAQKKTEKKIGRKEGVYVRPSAAIERGSGFFVPGLEGPKVRLAGGLTLLLLTAVNHALSSTESAGNNFEEALAVVFSMLVLVQGAIEYTKETMILQGRSPSSSMQPATGSLTLLKQKWNVPTSHRSWKERVEWGAQTYLSLTPATNMALIGPGAIVHWLGTEDPPTTTNNKNIEEGCRAALETCFSSSSGRVALPATHPVVTLLVPANHSRCVVLQRVDEMNQLCWMFTSDQLLASFTKRDLQWIGQLALYVQQPLLKVQ